MPLTGNYLRSIDDKGRIAVPKRIKDELGEETKSVFLAPGTEKSILIYDRASFDALATKLAAKPNSKSYQRLFFSRSDEVELDSQGRIRIPDWLARHANLSKEAYILGVQDHAEIWDRSAWETFMASAPDFDELSYAVDQ